VGDAEDDPGREAIRVGADSGVEAGVRVVEDPPVYPGKDAEVGSEGEAGIEAVLVGVGDALAGLHAGSTDEKFGVGAERNGGKVDDGARANRDGFHLCNVVGGEDGAAEIEAEIDEREVGSVVVDAESATVCAGGIGNVQFGGSKASIGSELGEAGSGGDTEKREECQKSFQTGSRGPDGSESV
jgi:hypothetical protein